MEAVASYVDGELSRGARWRAEQHLLACPECRSEVMCQQSAAARLRDSCEVRIPPALRRRLAALSESSAALGDRKAGDGDGCGAGNAAARGAKAGGKYDDARYWSHRKPDSVQAALEAVMRSLKRAGHGSNGNQA